MKKLVLLLATALFSTASFAQQANAVFFSEFGEEFTLFINGQQQNANPAPNVKVENVKQDFFQIRVDFADPTNAGFQANVGVELGAETTYIIKKNRKGVFVARPHSVVPLDEVVAAPTPAPAPAPTRAPAPQGDRVEIRTEAPGTIEQTTTVTTTTGKPNRERVGINMQVPGGGVNISIDGMDTTMEIEETTTITTTTTTTTTGARPAAETIREEPVVRRPAVPGYTGPTGCDWPVEDASIKQMKSSIESKSFEDTKMTVAKQATRNKCLTAAQVKEIMALFTFEDSKLDYAKFAYDYTYDVGNYYILNDAFTFSSSIDELNRFIERK